MSVLVKSIVLRIIQKLQYINGKYLFHTKSIPTVLSIEKTVSVILQKRLSVCRFGDGEFNMILGGNIGFQKKDDKLANELASILQNPIKNCLIGIPGVFGDISTYRADSQKFWYKYRGGALKKIMPLLSQDIVYADTNATRFQTGFGEQLNKKELIKIYKEIWNDRECLFIEGEKTRMGVGNDLFANCKAIKRILVPAQNAYDRIDDIENFVKKNVPKGTLIILACGPTATALAYRLSLIGYQAIDLGHLDIQYEYYKNGSGERMSIPGKYNNEIRNGSQVEDDICDEQYYESIIKQFN